MGNIYPWNNNGIFFSNHISKRRPCQPKHLNRKEIHLGLSIKCTVPETNLVNLKSNCKYLESFQIKKKWPNNNDIHQILRLPRKFEREFNFFRFDNKRFRFSAKFPAKFNQNSKLTRFDSKVPGEATSVSLTMHTHNSWTALCAVQV